MKAVVLAAGAGTRLRPLTADRPKGLVEVNGRPLLSHCFDRLVDLGVDEIVVVIGYRGDDVVDHYGTEFDGTPVSYRRQGDPRGLADALLAAESAVEDDFVVTYGDVVFEAANRQCLTRHRETDADATMLVTDVSRSAARRSGVCVLEDGEVVRLIEKPEDPPSTLALPGFFVLSPVVFHACHLVTPSDRGEYELLDALDLLVQAGRPVELVQSGDWRVNVNTPADLAEAERRLAGHGDDTPGRE